VNTRQAHIAFWFAILTLAACGDPSDPSRIAPPSFAVGGVGRPVVLVNPNMKGSGTATTIQEGIDMVDRGGKVLVLPGTYDEAIVIDKGLTLEGLGGESGPVVVSPSGTVGAAIHVATPDPVTIRGLSVRYTGTRGLFGDGVVDLTVERVSVVAVSPPLGVTGLISVINDAPTTGRARAVVRESSVDGSLPSAPSPPFAQIFGITVAGDIDARLEGNVIRRTGGACVWVRMSNDLGAETNADVLHNDLDECYPLGRAGGILVGSAAGVVPSPTHPVTATGIVNIAGNTIRNSSASCLASTAINYEFYTGRIERNRIVNVVQDCAASTPRNLQGAIWVGSLRGFPPAAPAVRFNDLVGNAHAGLRIGANQSAALDASCNWWGSPSGPSGAGTGTGDAVVVEAGATTPVMTPFATAPIAGTDATGC